MMRNSVYSQHAVLIRALFICRIAYSQTSPSSYILGSRADIRRSVVESRGACINSSPHGGGPPAQPRAGAGDNHDLARADLPAQILAPEAEQRRLFTPLVVDGLGLTHAGARDGDGHLIYQAPTNFVGIDTLEYTLAYRGGAETARERVDIAVNNPIEAQDDFFVMGANQALASIDVLANDVDPV